MDEQWKEVLSRFETVWQRVSGKETQEELPQNPQIMATEEKQGPLIRMEQLMNTEASMRQWYGVAAVRAERRSGEALRRLAAECGKSLKLLQTEYFLMQGDTWVPRKQTVPAASLLDCLRRIYMEEQNLQEMYWAAANTEETAVLRRLYGELELRCAARMKTLHALVQRVLG